MAVDIGGSKIEYLVLNYRHIEKHKKIYYNEYDITTKEKFLLMLKNIINTNEVKMAYLSVAGYIKDGKVLNSPNLKFINGIDFKKELKGLNKLIVENDANAFAFALSKKYNISNLIAIVWGTGVGMGIIYKGEIFYGDNGFAGEVGHIKINEKTLEEEIGTKGIIEKYSVINKSNLYPVEIFQKDRDFFKVTTLPVLSRGLSIVYQLFNINTIFLGGGIGNSLDDDFIGDLEKEIKSNLNEHPQKNIVVKKANTTNKEILKLLAESLDQ